MKKIIIKKPEVLSLVIFAFIFVFNTVLISSVFSSDDISLTTIPNKGKKGKIVRVLVKENKVIIEGLNMMKRHRHPRKSGEKGTIKNIEMPIHASNVKKGDK